MRQFAGFEMVMMAGAMSAAAALDRIIVVDGFIATTVVATPRPLLDPNVLENCVFCPPLGRTRPSGPA